MPALTAHQSTEFCKTLLLGDPGAGKTGGLVSLVKAGYKLRIYDFDNLLGSLVQFVMHECPDKVDNVVFQTFTDKMKGNDAPIQMVGGSFSVQPFVDGIPNAFARAMRQMNNWKTDSEDLGNPASWGPDTFMVIDSLTTMSASAFRYCQAMNPSAKEQRTYYFAAQQMIMNVIALLCSAQMKTNVIMIAHVAYDKDQYDVTKGFPRSVGAAIQQQIAAHFNSVLLVESQGSGTSVKRVIRTNSTGIIDLKNPAPFKVADRLPLETGLADFVAAVRGK